MVEMKIRFLVLVLLFHPAWGFAAACNQACLSSTDCTAGCNVCIGFCVACADLADATACADTATGADLYCGWTGVACIAEMPKKLVPLFTVLFPILLLYLSRRKLKMIFRSG